MNYVLHTRLRKDELLHAEKKKYRADMFIKMIT